MNCLSLIYPLGYCIFLKQVAFGPENSETSPGGGGQTVGDWPHQWLQLPLVHQAELADEVVEVLVAGVDVRLGAHLRDAVEVVDVDMHKHSEQPGQNLLHHLQEVLGERRACGR